MRKLVTFALLFISFSAGADTWARTQKAPTIVKQATIVQSIIKAATVAEVPKELLIAICWVESNHRSNVGAVPDGDSDSYGICQVKLETAKFMDEVYRHEHKVTKAKLMDPYVNAFYAAKYLKYQLTRYNGDWKKAVDAYNKGHHVSSKSAYVKKVMKQIARNP